MFGMENEFNKVREESKEEYRKYKEKVGRAIKKFEDTRDQYNAELTIINDERWLLRQEINRLYEFLKAIGGSMDRKITVFDFKTESFAPNMDRTEIPPIEEPDFQKEYWLFEHVIKTALKHSENKKKLEKYITAVEEKKEEYKKDLDDRGTEIRYMQDGVEIATIYRNIIAIIIDTIKDKIIPEFEYIQAFLYADAIRELVIDGSDFENVEPCKILEYKGTQQDIHYQFVKNAFDFYDVITNFFRNTVLTNILADRVVSEEEKEMFQKNIDIIKDHIGLLESTKVV